MSSAVRIPRNPGRLLLPMGTALLMLLAACAMLVPQRALADSDAPQVVSLRFEEQEVHAGKPVHLVVGFADEVSGVASARVTIRKRATLKPGAGGSGEKAIGDYVLSTEEHKVFAGSRQSFDYGNGRISSWSGTPYDGSCVFEIEIPTMASGGTWTVSAVELADLAGNRLDWSADGRTALGTAPPEFTVDPKYRFGAECSIGSPKLVQYLESMGEGETALVRTALGYGSGPVMYPGRLPEDSFPENPGYYDWGHKTIATGSRYGTLPKQAFEAIRGHDKTILVVGVAGGVYRSSVFGTGEGEQGYGSAEFALAFNGREVAGNASGFDVSVGLQYGHFDEQSEIERKWTCRFENHRGERDSFCALGCEYGTFATFHPDVDDTWHENSPYMWVSIGETGKDLPCGVDVSLFRTVPRWCAVCTDYPFADSGHAYEDESIPAGTLRLYRYEHGKAVEQPGSPCSKWLDQRHGELSTDSSTDAQYGFGFHVSREGLYGVGPTDLADWKRAARRMISMEADEVVVGSGVSSMAPRSYAGYLAETLVIKTRKLAKKSVRGSLEGSEISTVRVDVGSRKDNARYAKKYRKIFTKGNCGKKVRVVPK